MKLFFVANSMSHYNRIQGDYKNEGIKRILLNFIELSAIKEFSFDPSIEYIVDSGAHAFQQLEKSLTVEEMDRFVDAYGIFISKTCHLPNVTFYAEMDVDMVFGYDKVKEWREQLSAISPKVAPVWHPTRERNEDSLDEWIQYCKDYKWISFGGSWKLGIPDEIKFGMVRYAHDQGVKVHAMGCTSMPMLLAVPYYSVDSSSWLECEEHGLWPVFDFVKMKVDRKNYKLTELAGLDYRTRTRLTIRNYLKLEKNITDYWLSREFDWSVVEKGI